MTFDELTEETRAAMLREFESEWAADHHFVPSLLTASGVSAWPDMMREAILRGDETTLARALADGGFIKPFNTGGASNPLAFRAEQLARSEFNTWYIRGLASRLLSEGVTECEVYRADPAAVPDACVGLEGVVQSVQQVYAGHRAKYWPSRNPQAFAIPTQPGCHHSIRRIPQQRQSSE